MLRLSNITKRFGQLTAVDSIDLELETASTHVLIGPSGCGKSTLLRIMIGLIIPDCGSVSLDDKRLESSNFEDSRCDFGYVIQSGGLFPHLTVEQNAALPAVYAKWPREKIDSRIQKLRELTQLPSDNLARFPAQLSGGQQQRVCLMRALMLDPKILLLDEPLGSLDPMIRNNLQSELRDIFCSLGKTVVLVTHDLHEADFFADQIVLLRNGKIVQKGTASEFVDKPANSFVTEFIRSQQSHDFGTQRGPQ